MKTDWKWWMAVVVMAIGWGMTLGVIREQVRDNTDDILKHGERLPYHAGVRVLTDANSERIRSLEIIQAEMNVKLDAILAAIEKHHR